MYLIHLYYFVKKYVQSTVLPDISYTFKPNLSSHKKITISWHGYLETFKLWHRVYESQRFQKKIKPLWIPSQKWLFLTGVIWKLWVLTSSLWVTEISSLARIMTRHVYFPASWGWALLIINVVFCSGSSWWFSCLEIDRSFGYYYFDKRFQTGFF